MSRAIPLALTVGLALSAALAVAACSAIAGGGSSGSGHERSPEPAASDAGRSDRAGWNPTSVGLEGAGLPTLIPTSILGRVPTRVRIPDLGIDLAVVAPPDEPNHYPFCNVAEFMPSLSRPGRPGATFLYAHARNGMFLPILERSRIDDGQSMIGLDVQVYTSDDRRFDYRIDDVRRHVVSLDFMYRTTAERLMVQTSEGPHGTIPKTMVIASPTGETAADHQDAHPEPHPVRCG